MKIAMFCPFGSGPARGNRTTIGRLADHLQIQGYQTLIINLDINDRATCRIILEQERPDLLHAFHAYYTGPVAREAGRQLGIPYLITITGSDLFDPAMRSATETYQAIKYASAVISFDQIVSRSISEVFPDLADRITVIPQGVSPLPVTDIQPFENNGNFIVLMPAALRPVKGIVDAMEALSPLAGEFPELRMVVAGGTLDADYAGKVQLLADSLPWVKLLGDVPHQSMGAVYEAADLVLNASHFEGGMANALLEAMAMKKPVIASDVPGNRSLIRNGINGWLYRDQQELQKLVRQLMLDPQAGKIAGIAGRLFVDKNCSPHLEAKRHAALYRSLLPGQR